MAIERLELRGGQWADLRTSPTHKQNHAIVNAAERAAGGKGTYSDWAEQCGVQLLVAWSVQGEDGQPLRIEQWEDCPADLMNAICTRAQELWGAWSKSADPFLGTSRSSSDTSSASPSE